MIAGVRIGEKLHQQLLLGLAEVRIPHVEDQDGAQLVAVVPGFMTDGVIEQDQFSWFPDVGLLAHPQGAVRRNDQWQMNGQAGVGGAIVWGLLRSIW